MKLWIDDVRPAPEGYEWAKSVHDAMYIIMLVEQRQKNNYLGMNSWAVELIDIDHDAGEYAQDGGDYIKLLDWLELTSRNYPIHIHSMNPVGVENMRRIIQRNGWMEV